MLEREKGVEPSLSAWEADVLPLNYSRFPSKPIIGQLRVANSSVAYS